MIDKFQTWFQENSITEVECLVPDLGGIARGKILPTNKPFASANRLVTAFNLGLPVIASASESHKPFSEFYAKSGTNQAKKLFENPTRWHKKVTFAQNFE